MNSGLNTVGGVEVFSSLLYRGDKVALQHVTKLGWGGVAETMGLALVQKVLQESESVYAIFFVSHVLRHLVNFTFVTADLISLEGFLSWLIVERHNVLNPTSVDTLIRLLCSVVKQGYCDAPELKNFPRKVSAALQLEGRNYSEEHVVLSCTILSLFIDEIEKNEGTTRGLINHKRANSCFRNESLLPLFRAASQCLKRLQPSNGGKSIYSLVSLLKRILLVDFTGSGDEATDDAMTREFPQEWATDLIDQGLLVRLWDLYATPNNDIKFLCDILESLTPLVSLNASLYSSRQQQTEWMNTILPATLSIMKLRSHLEERTILREFCRLLNRIKPSFSIDDMRRAPCYEEWVQALAEFSKLCFHNWRHARESFLSLTSIWAKLVGSQSYCKEGQFTLFELFAPDVCLVYMMSNQEQAVQFASAGETSSLGDSILDTDMETLLLEFEFVSQLLRFCGEKAENYLIQELSSLLELLKTPESQLRSQLPCVCERLACIITLASSWLSSYRFSRNGRALDSSVLIACLNVAKRSCQLSFTHFIPSTTRRHFHVALLTFLRSAWRILLLDRCDESRKLRDALQNSFCVKSVDTVPALLLGIVVDEVMDCISCCDDNTIFEALHLLGEMAQSPSTAVIMKALPFFNYTPTAATNDNNNNGVGNLLVAGNLKIRKDTTAFYRVHFHMSRIKAQVHFLGCTTECSWRDFVQPLFEELNRCLNTEMMTLSNDQWDSVTRVICSWRGVFRSCVGQNEYKILLRYFSPCLFLLTQPLQGQLGSVCGVQLLRLIDEITENRHRRINFGANGVEGYHLFRYASVSLDIGVNLVMEALNSGEKRLEEWGIKCLRILIHTGRNILTGGYCNLGVLRLYEDKALMMCLNDLWRAMLLVDRTRFCHYEKLARMYIILAGELLRDVFLWFLCEVPIGELLTIIHMLEFSLGHHISCSSPLASLSAEALGVFTSTLCCVESDYEEQRACMQQSLLQTDPNIFSRLLRLALDVIVSRKCSSSVAEVFLRTLITLDGGSFTQLAGEFASFPLAAGKDAEVRAAFELLGSSASESVRKNNKSLFTKQFQHFSTIVANCLC